MVTKAELYEALRQLLPFAEVDVECRLDYLLSFPDDPEAEPEKTEQGRLAVGTARRLVNQRDRQLKHDARCSAEARQRRSLAMKDRWKGRNNPCATTCPKGE